jgi:hypothetical protein
LHNRDFNRAAFSDFAAPARCDYNRMIVYAPKVENAISRRFHAGYEIIVIEPSFIRWVKSVEYCQRPVWTFGIWNLFMHRIAG